jgi:hypothetical protein
MVGPKSGFGLADPAPSGWLNEGLAKRKMAGGNPAI